MIIPRIWIFGLALLLAPRLFSQGVLTQILTNGPTDKRINLVFLSEGYLQGQSNLFVTDARVMLAAILRTPPLNVYSNYFNAFTIFVSSVESGSDHPSTNVFRNTYFNSSYDSFGIARLITIPPNDHDNAYDHGQGKVEALLQNLLPEYDVSLLIVNDTAYGGSGGSPLIASVHNSSRDIAVHELGHLYSGLGDEYDSAYPGYPEIEEPNTTIETNRAAIKWRNWILPATPIPTPETSLYASVVGLFEGAHYHTSMWYRPRLNCAMQTLGMPFCEVCSEAFVKATYGFLRPIQSNSPPTNSSITLVDTQAMTMTISRLQPVGYNITAQWFTNGVPVAGATNGTFTIAGSTLPPGTNQVKVEVTDPTSKVRTDPFQLLNDSRTWSLDAQVRPRLEARRFENKVVLSWPESAAGYVLERRSDLRPGFVWLPGGGTPIIVSNRFTLTNVVAGGNEFYRLRK